MGKLFFEWCLIHCLGNRFEMNPLIYLVIFKVKLNLNFLILFFNLPFLSSFLRAIASTVSRTMVKIQNAKEVPRYHQYKEEN